MEKRKTALAICGVTVLTIGLSGCGAAFEGSGNKDAASAEQLALTAPDPWTFDITANADTAYKGKLYDGVYVGEGLGMAGKITTTLMIEDRRITVLAISQDGETASVGGFEAIRDGIYARMIEAAQSSEIDTISGATITTAGVRQAVDDALAQATTGVAKTPQAETAASGEAAGNAAGASGSEAN